MNGTKEITLATQILEALPLVSQMAMAELRNQDDPIVLNQVMVLRMLLTRPFNLSDLAKEHMVSLPTMSGTVSRMVKQGWITRTRSQEDRRVVLIELTAVGRARLESVLNHFANNIAARLNTLSPAEKDDLERGLFILKNIFTP